LPNYIRRKPYADAVGKAAKTWNMPGYPCKTLCRATEEEPKRRVPSIGQSWES